ncbi:unnamed protein product [Cyclocybe aegerita]|uniref:Major facilitator superfamily (MFS) profile domain-containing protein n=1 Tax=Cyclocybe aegerita TaxID=1973307 RepID=A0A8S0WYU2_CYCAE|nr:unnamed protein product [Cyclocybe aegerita]
MFNQLFKGSLGFAWGVRVSGFIVLTMLLAANLFMSAKPSVNAKGRPKPDLKVIMTDAPYLITILAVFVTNWGVFFPYFYLQLYAFLHGVNQTTAFYLISVLNASGIPGRIIPNLIADRIGPFNVAVPCILISNALIYALFGIKSVASIIVFAILYGFFSGAIFSITAPAFAELSRDPSEVGIRFGIAFFLSALGALIGTPVTGALLGHHFNWNRAITFSGVSFSAGVLFLVVARQILSKRKNSQRV